MNIDPNQSWIRILEWVLLVLWILVIAVNAWVAYDRHKLNKRYEESIESWEAVVEKYDEMARELNNGIGGDSP